MTIAPIRNAAPEAKPWEGDCSKKPWEYNVSVCIPCLDSPELTEIAVGLLRLQTEKPFILIIDTGSTPENLAKVQSLAAEDLEVHSLRLNGCRHGSDYVAMACDLAHALCRTKYLFHTHQDCFLRKRTVLAEFMAQCDLEHPVVAYEITPRPHAEWRGFFGHTAMMYLVEVFDNFGITWSQRRICKLYNIEWSPDCTRPNVPDTEFGANILCREHGIPVKIVGHEENYQRNISDDIDHCRTATSSKLYCPEYWKQCQEWLIKATSEAKERIKQWKMEDKVKTFAKE